MMIRTDGTSRVGMETSITEMRERGSAGVAESEMRELVKVGMREWANVGIQEWTNGRTQTGAEIVPTDSSNPYSHTPPFPDSHISPFPHSLIPTFPHFAFRHSRIP